MSGYQFQGTEEQLKALNQQIGIDLGHKPLVKVEWVQDRLFATETIDDKAVTYPVTIKWSEDAKDKLL
jgi:hypothetical protein